MAVPLRVFATQPFCGIVYYITLRIKMGMQIGRIPFTSPPISRSNLYLILLHRRKIPSSSMVMICWLVAFAHPKWAIQIELEELTMPSVMNYFGDFTGGFDGNLLPREQVHLTAVRRSMLTSPLYLQAHKILMPLNNVGIKYPKEGHEAKSELSSIHALVDNLVKTNPMMSETLNSLAGWLSSQSIKPQLITLFDHVRLPGATITGRFVAIVYSVALWVHRAGSLPSDEAVQAATDLLAEPAASTEKFRGVISESLRRLHRSPHCGSRDACPRDPTICTNAP